MARSFAALWMTLIMDVHDFGIDPDIRIRDRVKHMLGGASRR
jgi:hypothetical protein